MDKSIGKLHNQKSYIGVTHEPSFSSEKNRLGPLIVVKGGGAPSGVQSPSAASVLTRQHHGETTPARTEHPNLDMMTWVMIGSSLLPSVMRKSQ